MFAIQMNNPNYGNYVVDALGTPARTGDLDSFNAANRIDHQRYIQTEVDGDTFAIEVTSGSDNYGGTYNIGLLVIRKAGEAVAAFPLNSFQSIRKISTE